MNLDLSHAECSGSWMTPIAPPALPFLRLSGIGLASHHRPHLRLLSPPRDLPQPPHGPGVDRGPQHAALPLLLPWHPRPLLFMSRPRPQHCHRLQGTLPRSVLLFPTPFPLTYLATHFDLCKYHTRHRQMLETPECCGRRPSMDDCAQICHSENSCLRASKPRS